jgi:DNA-binding ferritin-like protein
MNRFVPDSLLDNPGHWQERAEEARSIAEQMSDPDSKQMMLRIAEDYEQLAAHARRRMKGSAAQS